MIRHIVIAAWRNMAANRLISAIAILGLAVGIAAALLMALVVRNQMTFDEFLPGGERTYAVIVGNTFDFLAKAPAAAHPPNFAWRNCCT